MRGRCGCYLLILPVVLLWAGGQALYTTLSNRHPTSMSLADYSKSRPKAEWLELSDCCLAIDGGMHFEKPGSIEEVYIPLLPPGHLPGDKIVVLLATKDRALINLYHSTADLKTEDALSGFLERHKDLHFKRTVRGLVRFGIELKDKDRRKFADFIILDDGNEPSLVRGLVMTGGGLVLLALGLLWSRRSRRAPAAPQT